MEFLIYIDYPFEHEKLSDLRFDLFIYCIYPI